MPTDSFEVTLALRDGYVFDVDFGQPAVPSLRMDEPPPLGASHGPNAARVLAAAVGNCLSASALYCLRRARVDVTGLRTTVTGHLVRNERGRLRVGSLTVRLQLRVAEEDRSRAGRCLDLFEDFCVVTESVRRGIPVEVTVDGIELAPAPPSGQREAP